MNITTIYGIVFASIIGTYILRRSARILNTYAQQYFFTWLRQVLFYSNPIRRLRGSNTVNTAAAIVILLYIGLNVFCLVFGIKKQLDLAKRASILALLNLPPLYLGSRPNFVLDRLLHIQLVEISLLHRWAGRLCILHSIVHGVTILKLQEKTNAFVIMVSFRL